MAILWQVHSGLKLSEQLPLLLEPCWWLQQLDSMIHGLSMEVSIVLLVKYTLLESSIFRMKIFLYEVVGTMESGMFHLDLVHLVRLLVSLTLVLLKDLLERWKFLEPLVEIMLLIHSILLEQGIMLHLWMKHWIVSRKMYRFLHEIWSQVLLILWIIIRQQY